MQKVHEPIEPEPLERIHLYVVREEENRQPPSLSLLLLSFFLLCLLITVGVVVPYRPPLVRQTVKVPALFFSLKTFSVQVAVLPTGMKTYPATNASGTLTITNGSILSQHLPAGMIFTATNGIEVVTTASVDVAAGNGASYGVAYVSAKAINAGVAGNLSPLAIDAVYGTSLYIKNDQSFTGGKNSSSVPNIQPQDTQTALTKARATLIPHMLDGMLYQPCAEKVTGTANIHVTWTCQFVTYQIAGKVLKATVHGRFIMVDVLVIARKQILETKGKERDRYMDRVDDQDIVKRTCVITERADTLRLFHVGLQDESVSILHELDLGLHTLFLLSDGSIGLLAHEEQVSSQTETGLHLDSDETYRLLISLHEQFKQQDVCH